MNDAPWVSAVVVVTDEGDDTHDPREVARFGRALRDLDLDPLAYAQILVERQWPGSGQRDVITDPRAWQASLPADLPEPPSVQAVRT